MPAGRDPGTSSLENAFPWRVGKQTAKTVLGPLGMSIERDLSASRQTETQPQLDAGNSSASALPLVRCLPPSIRRGFPLRIDKDWLMKKGGLVEENWLARLCGVATGDGQDYRCQAQYQFAHEGLLPGDTKFYA